MPFFDPTHGCAKPVKAYANDMPWEWSLPVEDSPLSLLFYPTVT